MTSIGSERTWLYVPGHDTDKVQKALHGEADAIVLDLQDSVPASHKDQARATVASLEKFVTSNSMSVWVRVNPSGPDLEDDLKAVQAGRAVLAGIRIPQCESVAEVKAIADRVALPLQLLIESATGLLRAEALSAAHELVVGIGLGEADLSASLGVLHPSGLAWARGLLVAVARAARIEPIQSVWTALDDPTGLAESSREAARHGFSSRSVIHPTQIPIVNEAFTPSPHELELARETVERARVAQADGRAGFIDSNGDFVDRAVVARAEGVLARAAARRRTPDRNITRKQTS